MLGTFKPGDRLRIENLPFALIKKGDTVVFVGAKRDSDDFVVHRVADESPASLVTRGDNSSSNDEEPVTEKNIVGKVTHYERNGKIHKVWNRRLGMLRAKVLHNRMHVIKAVKFFLSKPYRMIKKTGIVAKLWRPEIKTIQFETQDGPLIKYIHKGRTVANCWVESNRWWFRRPYDFVIGPKLKT